MTQGVRKTNMGKNLPARRRADATAVLQSVRTDITLALAKCVDGMELAQTLVAGLKAERTDRFLCQRSGEIVSGPAEPDHALRLKAAEILARLHGLGQQKQLDVNVRQESSLADRLHAARARVGLLQTETTVEPSVTVDAEIVSEPVKPDGE
jgi:hypothetical protein